MTGMPEASLARELAICFSGIGVVTNFAAGILGNRLTTTEVVRTMAESAEAVKTLLERTLSAYLMQETACARTPLRMQRCDTI